jgi:transcriptional regulator with XRE-family HTH domain
MTRKEPTTLFGRRLREARRRAEIPQDRLGVEIGLDEGTASARISRYETGIHEPSFGMAVKLAQALRLPVTYFYCDDDELAAFVLVWEHLSRSERKYIKALVDSRLTAK